MPAAPILRPGGVCMDRRRFVESCSTSAACLGAAMALPASSSVWAAEARTRSYARVLLTNEYGDPLRTRQLRPQTNYVFHYPYEATPVFLLKLGQPALPQALITKAQESYVWPGGVGPQHSIVAFS